MTGLDGCKVGQPWRLPNPEETLLVAVFQDATHTFSGICRLSWGKISLDRLSFGTLHTP